MEKDECVMDGGGRQTMGVRSLTFTVQTFTHTTVVCAANATTLKCFISKVASSERATFFYN